MNIFNFHYCTGFITGHFANGVTLFILYHIMKLRIFAGFSYINLDFNLCIITAELRSNLYSGSSVIIKIKMRIIHAYDIHISVKTAIESKVCHLGINFVICSIIHCDDKKIHGAEIRSHIHSPGRISAVVMSYVFPVEINICRRVCTFYFKII